MLSKLFLATGSLRLRVNPDGKVEHNIGRNSVGKTACIIGSRIPSVERLPQVFHPSNTLDVKIDGLISLYPYFKDKYSFRLNPNYNHADVASNSSHSPGEYTISRQTRYEKCVVIHDTNPTGAKITLRDNPVTITDDMVLDLIVFPDLHGVDAWERKRIIKKEMKSSCR